MADSKIGIHVTSGSRNGYGDFARANPSVVVAVNQFGAFDELNDKTIMIYRSHAVYGDMYNDFDRQPLELQKSIAEYWYPFLKQAWLRECGTLSGIFFQPTNEIGGNDEYSIRKLLAYESRLMELAHQDGIKLVVGSFAGGAPHYEIWVQYLPEFIKKAGKLGHIYGRHVYGGLVGSEYLTDTQGNCTSDVVFRAEKEAIYLLENNIYTPIVLTECGVAGGTRNVDMDLTYQDFVRYDDRIMLHDNIIGIALFTVGTYNTCNISDLLPRLTTLISTSNYNPISEYDRLIDLCNQQTGNGMEDTFLDSVEDNRIIDLNVDAALQKRIARDGYMPVTNEYRVTFDNVRYAIQGAQKPNSNEIRSYYCVVNDWGNIKYFSSLSSNDYFFMNWPTTCKVITQGFGENPQNYTQFGLPGHSGIDIACSMGAYIYAVAPGVVYKSEYSGSYGNCIRIDHQNGYRTIYAHLNQLLVSSGKRVVAGEIIGRMGTTGNSTGVHLHIELRKDGATERGETDYPYDIIDITDFLDLDLPIPQINTGGAIDLLPYIKGAGILYELRMNNGNQERVQTQVDSLNPKIFYTVKNSQWEEFKYDDVYIYRGTDTSPGNNRYYTLRDNGVYWSKWIKRYMSPGERFDRIPYVQFYNKNDCSLSQENSGQSNTSITFVKKHESVRFESTGYVVNDVIELKWMNSESYYYGKNLGLVGWRSYDSSGNVLLESAVSEIHAQGTRPDNVREVIHCLNRA